MLLFVSQAKREYQLSILSRVPFSHKQGHPSCLNCSQYEASFFADFRGCLDSSPEMKSNLAHNQQQRQHRRHQSKLTQKLVR